MTEKLGGGEFTEEDEELATLLASQAAVAIDNARLYETATGWMRQLESLGEITRALSDELDPDVVVRRVCERLCELVDAETAVIALAEEGDLRTAAIFGDNAEKFQRTQASPRAMKARRVLERGQSERIDSTLDDPEMDQQLARELAIHSALMMPMRIAGEPLGVLMVFNRRGRGGRFSDTDMRLAELFAERAAQAIDLSRRVSREALERVIEAQERERRLLARELHDDAQQMLAAILIAIRAAALAGSGEDGQSAFEHLTRLTEATIAGIQRVTHHLSPPALEHDGLTIALSDLVRGFRGSALHVDVDVGLGERFDPHVELVLYRVAQEALTNTVKHADATRAWITLAVTAGAVNLSIRDDGVGFDAGATEKGLGLVAMIERLELIGGTLEVRSRRGAGTTVEARVPLKIDAAAREAG
jgi:signal transduction histidine kinase